MNNPTVASFIVLSECSRDSIIGMDSLSANSAAINLQEPCVSLSIKQAITSFKCEEQVNVLEIVDDVI